MKIRIKDTPSLGENITIKTIKGKGDYNNEKHNDNN